MQIMKWRMLQLNRFFAVGWQSPSSNQTIGQLDNFRQGYFENGFDVYISELQFPSMNANNALSLIAKFKDAITGLENVETNGNNTDVPFYRKVTESLGIEYARCCKVDEQLSQELNSLTNFDKIRCYIVTQEDEGTMYRFYIKALRTAKLNTRFILTAIDEKINIVDTEGDGKALPYIICYAESVKDNNIMQYVFSVQDYEAIFGLNESKLKLAKSNYSKFLSQGTEEPEYRISGEYKIKVSEIENEKIEGIIEDKRRIANALSKYSNEAFEYLWDDVKKANELSEKFMQTPFKFDEEAKVIFLEAESFEAWVSVISNTKKLQIASNQFEDRLADKVVS